MALKSGLALFAYTLPGSGPSQVVRYDAFTDDLRFSTIAPGGCGDLSAKVKIRLPRLPRQELAEFSHLCLRSGNVTLWQGEIQDPELGMNLKDGEYVTINALGLGASFKDDPRDDSYLNQTLPQIINNQMTGGSPARSNFLRIDSDQSAVLFQNPATVFSPVYPLSTMEEVVADTCQLDGDTTWGVWPHLTHTDSGGFPTGQLQVHARNITTVTYTALAEAGDIVSWRVMPSSQRSYNVIKIGYKDIGQTNAIGVKQYVDPRLNANGSQGTAPFPRRVYAKDLSSISTVTASVAQQLANTYGALYQNGSNVIEVVLRRVRDANFNPLPLAHVRADTNLLITTLTPRATPPTVVATAGVNMFYIVQSNYQEQRNGGMQVTVQCDNFVDTADLAVRRLQLEADTKSRLGAKTSGPVQALGSPVKFPWSTEWGGWVTAGGHQGNTATYATTLSQAPTSITMTSTSTSNSSAPTVNNMTQFGAHIYVAASANGAGWWIGNGQSVGN